MCHWLCRLCQCVCDESRESKPCADAHWRSQWHTLLRSQTLLTEQCQIQLPPPNEETVSLRMAVESPENVLFTYELAGPASPLLGLRLGYHHPPLGVGVDADRGGLDEQRAARRDLGADAFIAVRAGMGLLRDFRRAVSREDARQRSLGAAGRRARRLPDHVLVRDAAKPAAGRGWNSAVRVFGPDISIDRAVSVVPSLDNLWSRCF